MTLRIHLRIAMATAFLAVAPLVSPAGTAQAPSVAPPPTPDLGTTEWQKSAEKVVRYFRELLSLTPADRAERLRERPDAQRKALLVKLAEYDELTPEEREERLRTLQLRLYLRPLLQLLPEKRNEALAVLPEEYRLLIERRLRQWDQLPQSLQNEVVENEWMMHYVLRFEVADPAQQQALLQSIPHADRAAVDNQLAQWRALPKQRRQKMYEHFQQFFELSHEEKEKTLELFSEREREQMEQSLRIFDNLPPELRQLCLASFQRFSGMTEAERLEFLRNVDRWKTMTAEERETWRHLVTRLPPLPPGSFPSPPLPAGLQPQLPGTSVSSNAHILPPGIPGRLDD